MFICYATCADEVDSRSGTQGTMSNYHGNQAFHANNCMIMECMVKVIQPSIVLYTVKHLKSNWEVFIGQLERIRGGTHTIYTAACADEGGTQGDVHYSCII